MCKLEKATLPRELYCHLLENCDETVKPTMITHVTAAPYRCAVYKLRNSMEGPGLSLKNNGRIVVWARSRNALIRRGLTEGKLGKDGSVQQTSGMLFVHNFPQFAPLPHSGPGAWDTASETAHPVSHPLLSSLSITSFCLIFLQSTCHFIYS